MRRGCRGSKKVVNPGTVVETPSGPDSSGFCLISVIAALVEIAASDGEIIDTGPLELNVSIVFGVSQSNAAVAITPGAAGCP